MSKLLKSILLVAMSVAISSVTFAAGSGSSPKGKPFIAINDQIIEVVGVSSSIQDQIDLLVGRVDTLEQRVTANEGAITTLQNQNITLTTLVQQNITDIASIEVEILALQQANIDLNAIINANSGDIATLQDDVATNKALIITLQESILMTQDSIISLESSLQFQIDENLDLISAIQNEINSINDQLTLKQNLVNGICPDGTAVQQILSDGSLICGETGSMQGTLEAVESWVLTEDIPPGVNWTNGASCPSGFVVTGAGYRPGPGFVVVDAYTVRTPSSQSAYVVGFNSLDGPFFNFPSSIATQATCLRIAP